MNQLFEENKGNIKLMCLLCSWNFFIIELYNENVNNRFRFLWASVPIIQIYFEMLDSCHH